MSLFVCLYNNYEDYTFQRVISFISHSSVTVRDITDTFSQPASERLRFHWMELLVNVYYVST